MSEIVRHEAQQLSMSDQVQFAEYVTQGDMVPKDYRSKPQNALLAIGLGQSMDLTPAESLYRIDVIQGKPTASAELIASNIRKAGHTLRLELDERNLVARATVYRADDPEFAHTVTRDMAWAKSMGLATKDNYKKQPLTMLQHRATTAVGRLACPEALYGVQYTADELTDTPGRNNRARTPQPVEYEAPVDPSAIGGITPAQWEELLEAGAQHGLDAHAVGNRAAEHLEKQLSGPGDIPVRLYEYMMNEFTNGEVQE